MKIVDESDKWALRFRVSEPIDPDFDGQYSGIEITANIGGISTPFAIHFNGRSKIWTLNEEELDAFITVLQYVRKERKA